MKVYPFFEPSREFNNFGMVQITKPFARLYSFIGW